MLGGPASTRLYPETYIEALLVNEEPADQVSEDWDNGEIDEQTACVAWRLVANNLPQSNTDSN